MRPVVAVLRLVAVVVPVCTLILRGAGQEGPGGLRPPTCQPWHRDTELYLGASAAPTQPPGPSLHLPLSLSPGRFSVPDPSPGSGPLTSPLAHLTITGTAESTLQAVATPILASPGTPATVGTPQAQGALGCLSTAQGAALRSSEQASTASSHTSQGQVGGAQALYRGGEMRNEVGSKKEAEDQTYPECLPRLYPSLGLLPLPGHSCWTKVDTSMGASHSPCQVSVTGSPQWQSGLGHP